MLDFHSNKHETWFLWVLKGVMLLGFLVMLGRLADLQVIRGAYYKSLAEDNRVRRIPILAPRGSILARNGEVLVESKKEPEKEEKGMGTDIIIKWKRNYKDGADFGHVTGYLGLVKENEVNKVRGDCSDKGTRKIGSMAGRSGLEEQYDCILSGIDGEELVEVDAMGNRIRSLGRKEPITGEDIETTIDYGLQKKVSSLMQGKKGAVVAMRPNGEMLSLFSSPSFDPGAFIEKERQKDVLQYLQDKSLPLFNRGIGGMFHPGSVYKPLVAVAALQEGVIDEHYHYNDTGRITIDTNYGNFSYNNWYFTQYGGKEGEIDVKRALARSTDTFFYEVGDLLGIEKLDIWSHTFNLDEKTSIDMPGEIAGLVPSPEWKQKVMNERWFLGNTYHMAIGQGDLGVTPIAITSAINAIANGGEYCRPHLTKSQIPMTNVQDGKGDGCRDLGISQKTLDVVKEGMEKACQSGGTAFPFFDFELPDNAKVACKTGTAETEGGKMGDTHAWFTIFAPSENPEIVLTVLVERGGEGSKVAAPIARELFNYWFYEQYGREVPKKIVPSASTSVSPTPVPGSGE